jgi:serine/threonine-protein kinase
MMSGLIGQHLGQYEITALLGRGGMATVYRARQASMGRDVAIKVIKPELSETPDFVERFAREARTVASLSHPHILKVFDYGQHGELVFLVMELLVGGSLADLILQGPLSLQATTRITDQIASALDYAHELGIIHRDLKPQNVLLDSRGNAHLTDFGIAKIMSATALTQSGVAMGTPSYMAPEQWQGLPLDGRADVYALGVMLFEMLTGQLPFSAETPFSLMHKHVSEPPPPIRALRADLPTSIEAVLIRALAKNREQRYASAGDLASDAKVAISGTAPISPPPSTPSDYPTLVETPPDQLRAELQAAKTARRAPATPQASQSDTQERAQPLLPAWAIAGIGAVVLILVGLGLFASGILNPPTATPSLAPISTTAVVVAETQTTIPAATTGVPTATIAPPTTAAPIVAASSTPPAPAPTTAAPPTTTVPQTTSAPTATSTTAATTPPTATATQAQPNVSTLAAQTLAARATLTATANVVNTLNAAVAMTETAIAVTLSTATPTITPTPTATTPPPPTATSAPTITATAAPRAEPTGQIAFGCKCGPRYQVHAIDPANPATPSTPLLRSPGSDDFGPGWSADGSQIAFTTNRAGNNEIYAMNADGSNLRRLTNHPADDYGPAWSPDGLLIAFHSNRGGNFEIWVMNSADGSNLRRLTNSPGIDADPTWSHDGTKIAFFSNRSNSPGIYVMDVNGGNVKRLTPAGLEGSDPAWSPDGTQIVFTVPVNRQPTLYIMNADGVNPHPLLQEGQADDQAAWSPDSQYIVFRSKRGGKTGLYIVDTSGVEVRQLTTEGTDTQFPTWRRVD